jgi:hypothetical protein
MKEDLYSHKTKKRLVYTNRFFVLQILLKVLFGRLSIKA